MEIGNEEIIHQNVWPTNVVKSPLLTRLGSSWEIEVGQKTFLFCCLPLEENPLHGSRHGSGSGYIGFQSTLFLSCYSSNWMSVLAVVTYSLWRGFMSHMLWLSSSRTYQVASKAHLHQLD